MLDFWIEYWTGIGFSVMMILDELERAKADADDLKSSPEHGEVALPKSDGGVGHISALPG